VIQAKTHFSMLLDRVAGGEEVVITKHGQSRSRAWSLRLRETGPMSMRRSSN